MCHLHPHRPAAEHHQPPRRLPRGRDLAVGPGRDLRKPGNGRHQRTAAGRDHHRLSRLQKLAAGLDFALADERPGSPHQLHSALPQPRQMTGVVEVGDHLVAAAQHRLHVKRACNGLGDAGDAPALAQQLLGPQQRLRRHAGVEGALAPHEALLDDRDLASSLLGQPAGDDLARRPGADHDHVEAAVVHRSPCLTRSALEIDAQTESPCRPHPAALAFRQGLLHFLANHEGREADEPA